MGDGQWLLGSQHPEVRGKTRRCDSLMQARVMSFGKENVSELVSEDASWET